MENTIIDEIPCRIPCDMEYTMFRDFPYHKLCDMENTIIDEIPCRIPCDMDNTFLPNYNTFILSCTLFSAFALFSCSFFSVFALLLLGGCIRGSGDGAFTSISA